MRTIILAGGQGFQLDGYNKLLLRDPGSGEILIDKYMRLFAKTSITIVLGYKAVEVMQRYPDLHYLYNSDWKVTNNSYSLALALNEEPCYVLSCDLLFNEDVLLKLSEAGPNCILTKNTDNRQLNALNCSIQDDKVIDGIYQGDLRTVNHPEAIGVYKLCDKELLRKWKKKCITHSNLFTGQNLPFSETSIYSVDVGNSWFEEVNTVIDYMRILEYFKGERS
jgi:choline kinase